MEQELFELISTMKFPLLGVVVLAVIKDKLFNLIDGILFRFDKDFNEDDPIYLQGREARITKIGIFKTKVHMKDRNTMRKINNFDIDRLVMEKPLGEIK